ncbi:MAG: ATP-binding cassette domain-containing protein [Paraprevotella sp.]|nr:ATP-binding cassette domain-containing protein [Paraprevotella sp.]
MQNRIEIVNGVTRHPLYRMKEPINLSIGLGAQIAIVGANGSGKSRLVDVITGRYPLLLNEVHYDFSPSLHKLASENIKYITFRDSYGDSDNSYYYQQRWNQHDIDEKTPTVGQVLNETFDMAENGTGYGMSQEEKQLSRQRRMVLKDKLYEMFHLSTLLDKYVILLSSGDLRKFQLTKTLLSDPRMLIMDNPFIGLDAQTRDQLSDLLRTLIRDTDLQIVLVLSKTDDIPDFITHVIPVEHLKVLPKISREAYCAQRIPPPRRVLDEEKEARILALPEKEGLMTTTDAEGCILKLNKVSIRYGQRTILNELDWTVKQNEKWALQGENGAGKSTLLSLICADNPQSYACDIELFGRKRGSGESIWEIKKHIGYVSPEMHRAYLKDLPAIDIVASGLNDSVGLYVRPKPEQRAVCEWWMDIFGIAELKDRTFLKLSSGEQRLCLLTRAFVKDPELLILDEPLHGLDDRNRQLTREIISAFCRRPNKTMVMVTHYAEELPDVITHNLFLKKNK